MSKRLKSGDLHRVAAILTWALVTGLALYVAIDAGERYRDIVVLAVTLALVNLSAMWLAMAHGRPSRSIRLSALWVQLLSALAIGWLLPLSFMPIYTIIWIAIATGFYPLRTCWWLLGAILLAWYLIMRIGWGHDGPLMSVTLFGTFHLFALLTARNAAEAEAARDKVEVLNRELMATQQLLSEASRQGERTRISRDLHDLLGHHLTALSINLQIAERLTDGAGKSKVEECRALARLLLSDVREAVSTLRDENTLDLSRAIALLVDNVPQLDISLQVEEGIGIDDVEVAETLLRCVQEAITNTLRHASAKHSWIRIWQQDGNILLEVRDDGSVADDVAEGNGLAGMRERLAAIHGSLRLGRIDDALLLRVEIPLAG
jgi:signal transduction histidine kinase